MVEIAFERNKAQTDKRKKKKKELMLIMIG